MARVIFNGVSDDGFGSELYISDGTAAGTVLLKDINAGAAVGNPSTFFRFGNQVLFRASTEAEGPELWITDGTATGTRLVRDINPGPGSSMPGSFVTLGNKVLFTATAEVGTELYVTDGTSAGTMLVRDINTFGNSAPAPVGVLGASLLFSAVGTTGGRELYITDGTSAGTTLLKDINTVAGTTSSNPGPGITLGTRVVFAANNGVNGSELWVSDGTAAGTVLLLDINAGNTNSNPALFTQFGSRAVFRAFSAEGNELWITDGTTAGTMLLKDINPGGASSTPQAFSVFGDKLLFAASDGSNGQELWITDGTTAGTVLLKDLELGAGSSFPSNFTVLGNKVVFSATTAAQGTELWVTDGTVAGTTLLKDIAGAGSANPTGLVVSGDRAFFRAVTATEGSELWVTDGTAAGTQIVKDIFPGSTGGTGTIFALPDAVTTPPAGTDATLTLIEDGSRTLAVADFGFTDADGNTLLAVRITTPPLAGALTLDSVAVTADQSISAADITAGKLVFTPAANASGATYASFTFQVQDNSGTNDLDLSANTITFAVTAVDDAPVAVADTGSTTEAASVSIIVLSNDTDVDGGPKDVATINGATATVGTPILLASGATATLNADGTITYNPNGAFNYLIASTTTGAVNTSATDSFTYTLNGGSNASVTVTITGVNGAGDEQRGNGGNNTITGTGAAEYFNLDQGGTDGVNAGGGDDLILFGGSYDPTDSIDGGTGTDQFGIRGNYTATLSNVLNTEYIAILSGTSTRFGGDGTARYDYNLTTTDATVAAGVQYVVQANELVAGENLRFDGSAESDGRFLMYAGMGVDTLTGGAGNDAFYFGEGGRFTAADTVVGGLGSNDQLGLRGNYDVTLGANTIGGIEVIALLSAKDVRFGPESVAYTYNLVLDDGNVAAGARLTVTVGTLRSDESASVNGSAETNGSFFFIGGAGADVFTGGAGEDRLFGGLGTDTLRGGGGNDVFVYEDIAQSTTGAPDAILDFTLGDRIDLSGIDANTTGAAPGDQAFAFIGSAVFGNVAGQLRVTANGGGWLVEGDIDGNGIADFAIQLTVPDAHPITATDFIL